jgi:hypothetical protein
MRHPKIATVRRLVLRTDPARPFSQLASFIDIID